MLTWNGPEVVAALKVRAGEAVKDVARRVLAESVVNVPIDTGRLRDSGHVIDNPDDAESFVIFDTHYAIYVHDGTPRMPARPWLQRACLTVQAESSAAFSNIVNRT